MEEKKTIFNYISQTFATYGIIVVIFSLFSIAIGGSAGEYSTLFVLGGQGLTMGTLFQLLLLAVIVTVARLVFLSDTLIKDMSMPIRLLALFMVVMIATVIMIIVFDWFPVKDVTAWIGFFVSFVVCTFISVLITRIKERLENDKMQEALDRYNKE